MRPRRRQRLIFVGVVLVGVAVATALVLTAIGENMLYFYSPTQIAAGEAPRGHDVRVGGLVVAGSVARQASMPSNLAAVPPRMAIRSSSLKSGVFMTRSTSVLVQGNG